jgi:uncharacterized protein
MNRSKKPGSAARGAALAFCLAAALALPAGAQAASDLAGTWLGELKTPAQSLRIVFNVTSEAGALKATMDSPDQGAKGIPTSSVAVDGRTVKIEAKLLGASYKGELSGDGKRIAGSWSQRGASLPLILEKQAGPLVISRPQEPKPPFPYKAEEVSIAGKKAGIKLAGTIVIPAGKGPFPAVVLVTGSGAQNRDEELLGHKPFLVLADYLARRGIMSLRCDDRGFGSSSGDFSKSTTYDFADDAEAAFEYLAKRPEARAGHVGIVGHSEGGMIAPLVASREASVSFIVLLAGPGMKGEDLILLQGRAIAKAQGASEADISEAMRVNKTLYAAALAGSEEEAKAKVKKAYLDWAASSPQGKAIPAASLEQEADEAAASMTTPWYRAFLAFDPAPYLAKVGVPVLALDGSKDLQVPAKENLAGIASALGAAAPRGPNKKNKLVELEGLNHLFQHALSGSPDEYGKIEETFAPEALKAVGDWILGL